MHVQCFIWLSVYRELHVHVGGTRPISKSLHILQLDEQSSGVEREDEGEGEKEGGLSLEMSLSEPALSLSGYLSPPGK